MGEEHIGKNVNISIGPMMSISCIAQCGRKWDLVADPFFLAGVAAHETILGMQSATS